MGNRSSSGSSSVYNAIRQYRFESTIIEGTSIKLLEHLVRQLGFGTSDSREVVKLFNEFIKFLTVVVNSQMEGLGDGPDPLDVLHPPPLVNFIWRVASLNRNELSELLDHIAGDEHSTLSVPYKLPTTNYDEGYSAQFQYLDSQIKRSKTYWRQYTPESYLIEQAYLVRLTYNEFSNVVDQALFKVFRFVDGTLFNAKMTHRVISSFVGKCQRLIHVGEDQFTYRYTPIKHPLDEQTADVVNAYPSNFARELTRPTVDEYMEEVDAEVLEGVGDILAMQSELNYLADPIAQMLHCSDEVAQIYIEEYLRFLSLFEFSEEPKNLIPSDIVNVIWELHASHSTNYFEFCERALPKYSAKVQTYGDQVGQWPPFQFTQIDALLTRDDIIKLKQKYDGTLQLYRFVTTIEPHPKVWPSTHDRFERNYLEAKWISLPRLLAVCWKCASRRLKDVEEQYTAIGLSSMSKLFKAIDRGSK